MEAEPLYCRYDKIGKWREISDKNHSIEIALRYDILLGSEEFFIFFGIEFLLN